MPPPRHGRQLIAYRAPQAEIAGLKERHGWNHIPWSTITDDFDQDFDVDEWHGTSAFIRDGDRVFRTYFISDCGDEATVRSHVARMLAELGVRDRVQTAVFCYENGIVRSGRPAGRQDRR